MSYFEKKIVTNGMFCIAAYAGYIFASGVYAAGVSGYLKIFHKDTWKQAIDEI